MVSQEHSVCGWSFHISGEDDITTSLSVYMLMLVLMLVLMFMLMHMIRIFLFHQ